jgi:hypothetical protein
MSGKIARERSAGYACNLDSFQSTIGSFEPHLRAENKSPKAIRTYPEPAQWFAAEYLIPQACTTEPM